MKGAIFDVDGTLLDSMTVWYDVLVEFYAEHGVNLTDEEAAEYKDLTLEESIPVITDRLKLQLSSKEIADIFVKKGLYQYEHILPLKKDADKYLKQLHDEGVKIAIATSGFELHCKKAFTRLGVWDLIDKCAYSSEVGVNKSNPDVYLLAAQRLGVKPEDCVVFEDISLGILGAKKGHFKTCAVYDKSNTGETELLKKIADRYIESWSELIKCSL